MGAVDMGKEGIALLLVTLASLWDCYKIGQCVPSVGTKSNEFGVPYITQTHVKTRTSGTAWIEHLPFYFVSCAYAIVHTYVRYLNN